MSTNQAYPRVRALERGLELIEALSELGWATPGQLAQHTGINRATIYRLLNTLELTGFVNRRLGDGNYFLTPRFKHIADGIRDDDWVSQVISPHLGRLLGHVRWPSDFAIFSSGRLIIRESTHRHSPMSINRAMVGKERPLIRSALGIAFLSAMSDECRQQVLSLAQLREAERARLTADDTFLMRRIQIARIRGYASSEGETEAKISAIAYPVCWRNYVLGAINIMFFNGVMTPSQAAERYLHELKACVHDIEKELYDLQLGKNTGWVRHKSIVN